MSGIFCPRCQTNIRIESDGKSCSNCGGTLIGAKTPPTLTSTEDNNKKRGKAAVAREAHNLEVAGSTPAPATTEPTVPELNAAATIDRKAAAAKTPTTYANGRKATAPKPSAKPKKRAASPVKK